MVTQIVKMQVADFNKWKQIHAKLDNLQKQHGLNNGQIAVDPENPNNVTLILNWRDVEEMRKYTQLPEVAQAMHLAGLKAPPQVKVFQEI